MNSPLPNAARRPPARFTIVVGSGKGGVGKSTVSLNLALALAESGAAVGILDADLYGPNIPLMLGLTRQEWTGDWTLARRHDGGTPRLLEPIERYGIKVMSTGFILAEDQPLLLEARTVRMLLAQLTCQVNWGELDYLVAIERQQIRIACDKVISITGNGDSKKRVIFGIARGKGQSSSWGNSSICSHKPGLQISDSFVGQAIFSVDAACELPQQSAQKT